MIGQGIRRISDRFTPFLRALAYLAVGSDGQVLTLSSGKPVWGDVADGYGEGQTWQNMTASRTYDTAYQNTTGRTITVLITARSNTTSTTRPVQVSADGATWVQIYQLDVSSRGPKPLTVPIPSGWYIKIVGAWDAGGASWCELR